jgi:hypothetical protein
MSSLGGSPPGPTAQQQNLQTLQATTSANQNLEENEQRKVILNAMQGTRVFRGSALSRSAASDTAASGPQTSPTGGISQSQQNAPLALVSAGASLLDEQGMPGSATPGPATSGGSTGGISGGRGGGGSGRGPIP